MKIKPFLPAGSRRTSLVAAGALVLSAVTALVGPAALAQTPAAGGKVMRIIVPYAPGGPLDVTARMMAEGVKNSLGTVIVENRPGAGGNIGVDAIAKAAPTGSQWALPPSPRMPSIRGFTARCLTTPPPTLPPLRKWCACPMCW